MELRIINEFLITEDSSEILISFDYNASFGMSPKKKEHKKNFVAGNIFPKNRKGEITLSSYSLELFSVNSISCNKFSFRLYPAFLRT